MRQSHIRQHTGLRIVQMVAKGWCVAEGDQAIHARAVKYANARVMMRCPSNE